METQQFTIESKWVKTKIRKEMKDSRIEWKWVCTILKKNKRFEGGSKKQI